MKRRCDGTASPSHMKIKARCLRTIPDGPGYCHKVALYKAIEFGIVSLPLCKACAESWIASGYPEPIVVIDDRLQIID